ncbi:uncharacterized protein DSM5745_05143 [Aspergillus mulundensis]|uniref:Uncharacterized protein n=1 Tax=Aspergillus mulundensis TaxID=1810919 RepID=A0A3D8S5Q6_9EURO|nr:hypothetical protein DSM5745_05143 [Aspergillus mulundensis]RDW81586.1 hypothetical protein DSM5745_05143 [Aspergillus mulundensis]
MSLQTLPIELVLLVAEHCDSQSDVVALTRTSKRLATILAPRQLEINIKRFEASVLTRAVVTNNIQVANAMLEGISRNSVLSSILKYRVQIPKSSHPFTLRLHAWSPPLWKLINLASCPLYKLLQESGKLDNLLYLAVDNGHLDMVTLLLFFGADPRAGHENHAEGEPAALVRASQRALPVDGISGEITMALVDHRKADMRWVLRIWSRHYRELANN